MTKSVLLCSFLFGAAAQLKTGCASCDCDTDGIVVVDGVSIDTQRPGCAQHIDGLAAFCYTHPDCAFPGASASQAFQGLKYFDCVENVASTSDCNAPPPTPPPTIRTCPQDGEWPESQPTETVTSDCPAGTSGSKTRFCSSIGVWSTIQDSCTVDATCTDGVQNGGETGIDCGGGCPDACLFCTGVNCGTNGKCNELEKKCDCSNDYTGARCETPPTNPCAVKDCGRGKCNFADGTCECTDGFTGDSCQTPPAPTCFDGVKNGNELGVDCGGPDCNILCESYDWEVGEWGPCSEECGGGVRTRDVRCVFQDGNTMVDAPGKCDEIKHGQKTEEPCNLQQCIAYTWVVGAWEPCTHTCKNGIFTPTQTRSLTCQSVLGIAPDDTCGSVIPDTTRDCPDLPDCPPEPKWGAGPWSACSRECGGGVQTRDLDCYAGTQVSTDCTGPKPEEIRACNLEACKNYRWVPCDWDECTATCNAAAGGMQGYQHHDVFCRTFEGDVADPEWCDGQTKPSVEEKCSKNLCMDYNWMADTKWSACVDGKQTRTFHCHAPDGLNAANEDCEAYGPPLPRDSRPCELYTCPSESVDAKANDSVRRLPGILASILGAFALSTFGKMRHAMLFVTLCVVFATPVSGRQLIEDKLEAHHYEDVKDFLLTALSEHTPKSESGHVSPFPHKLRVSFTVADESFEFDMDLHQDLFATGFKWRTDEGLEDIDPEIRSYSGNVDGGFASVTVYDWDKVFAVIGNAQDSITIMPAERVDVDMGERKGKMFAFRQSKVPGSANTPDMQIRRQLLQNFVGITPFNCATTKRTLNVGMACDPGWVDRTGSTAAATQQMAELIATCNQVYVPQLGVRLKITESQVATQVGSPAAWSLKPFSQGSTCGGSISNQLNDLRSWVQSTGNGKKAGIWHLMTNCWPPPGTVGLAYVGVLCADSYATGVSTYSRETWLTVAHEIGHNFGGPHSFDDGQGSTGGIMDYGNGETFAKNGQQAGVSQFNIIRENDLCGEITKTYQSNPPGSTSIKCWEQGDIGSTPTPPPTPPPTVPPTPCVASADQYNNCGMWASLGQCIGVNAGWMKTNCGASCCSAAGSSAFQQCLSFISDCTQCDIDQGVCLACQGGKSVSPRKDKCFTGCHDVPVDAQNQAPFGPSEFMFLRVSVPDTSADQVLASGTIGGRPFSWEIKDAVATFNLEWLAVTSSLRERAGDVELGVSTLYDTVEMDIAYERVPGLVFSDLQTGKGLRGAAVSFTSQHPSLRVSACRP